MRILNLTYAKAHLSHLIEEAAGGAPFVIAKAGKPMVKVVPIEAADKKAPRRLGFLKGQFKVPDDFDRMAEDEIASLFEDRKV
jgi:prevent-host-death family protein